MTVHRRHERPRAARVPHEPLAVDEGGGLWLMLALALFVAYLVGLAMRKRAQNDGSARHWKKGRGVVSFVLQLPCLAWRSLPRCGTGFSAHLWINFEPCGLICAGITWALVFYARWCVTRHVVYPWLQWSTLGRIHTFVFHALAFLALSSHVRAMLTDPGAVPKGAIPLTRGGACGSAEASENGEGGTSTRVVRRCKRCAGNFKPKRAHHCSICGRCVTKMDHHCPWVNSCVGSGNHKFFILFISYIFLMSAYALGLALGKFVSCASASVSENPCLHDSGGAMWIILLIMESVLFGSFTMCMIFDQWEVVATGTTQIDRLKGESHEVRSDVNEVFGGAGKGMAWHWMLPLEPTFPASVRAEILGYTVVGHADEEDGNGAASQLLASDEALDTMEGGTAPLAKDGDAGLSVRKPRPERGVPPSH